jgi:hypothetical protein
MTASSMMKISEMVSAQVLAKDRIWVLSALRGCPFPQLADGTFLRKWNHDHATDNAARYPTETLLRFAAPSIPQWEAASH